MTERLSEEQETAVWHMVQHSVRQAVKNPHKVTTREEFFKTFYEELAFQQGELQEPKDSEHSLLISNSSRTVHFYYMHDNHCFSSLVGATLDDIVAHASCIRKQSYYGMLSPPIILEGEKEIRRVAVSVHCCGPDADEQWRIETDKWKHIVRQDAELMSLLPARAVLDLRNADLNCSHEIMPAFGGGVCCTKCTGRLRFQ